jgi:Ca-activated chloride channel family protein
MSQKVKFQGDSGNEFIGQLWALRRVGWLLDEIRLRGESRELRDEVVDLARRFAIVTPYTSYLIVEDEARRGVPVASRSLPQLDRDSVAQSYYKKSWSDMVSTKDGYSGTIAGRGNFALKSADSAPAALEKAKQENLGGIIAGNAPAAEAPTGGTVAAKPKPQLYADKYSRASEAKGDAGGIARRATDVEQAARFVNGKSFTQNGNQWNDTSLQAAQNAKRNRVQFASADYFELLKTKPESAQWLALGNSITFTLSGEVYEVYE